MRKLFLFFIVLPVCLVIFYGAAWGLFYINVKSILEDMVTESKSNPTVTLYDEAPKISGFPFKPVITYTKGFMINGVKVTFPELIITGYPLPFMPIEINAPKGLSLSYQTSGRKNLELTKAHLIFEMPLQMVNFDDYHQVVRWQRDFGEVKIIDTELAHEEFYLKGHGTAGLNPQLQPELLLHSKIHNHQEFAERIMRQQGLSGFASAMALSVMNALSDKNDGTVPLDIKIKDREISIGPINAGKMPILYWER